MTSTWCAVCDLHMTGPRPLAWVGVKNFGFTEKQKNIEQGSTKLKELHVCIMRVQKKMAAWRSEVPQNAGKRYLRMSQSESRRVAHCMYVEIELKKEKKRKKRNFDFEILVLRKFRKITAISRPCT